MRKNTRLFTLLLLISMVGVLALTTSECISCTDDFPDEFSDLAVAWQNPILTVFDFHLNPNPFLVSFLKIFFSQRTILNTSSLRC